MSKTNAVSCLHLFTLFILLYTSVHVDCNTTPSGEELKAQKFPPCAACKVLISSFEKGIKRTSREKFDGGDSAWEEDKLGSYSKSETRLIEIQEHLCKEVERGETQCHALAEELEGMVEDWWFNHQQTYPDLYNYICIRKTERCCPKDHFGPQCEPCPGFPNKICSNNGKCKGGGTRKGSGGCFCDVGYSGERCSECANGYYASYKDENKLLCSPCHVACDGLCHGAGPNNCEKCTKGWYMLNGQGCFDIDECVKPDEHCPGNQFCVNEDGGYSCLNCDKACNGCTGDGPDMCIKCIDGYHKKGNLCISSDMLGRKQQENIARYATYTGLCVATCIIFQRNIYVASVIGLLVGIYISVSEYMIAHSNAQDATTHVDSLGSV